MATVNTLQLGTHPTQGRGPALRAQRGYVVANNALGQRAPLSLMLPREWLTTTGMAPGAAAQTAYEQYVLRGSMAQGYGAIGAQSFWQRFVRGRV